jgi:hypothetical protein
MEARLQFLQLLDKHGLVRLAGSAEEALDWLEGEAIRLTDSISRRRRFIQMMKEARAMLNQQVVQEARTQGDKPPGEKEEEVRTSTAKRYRRFML